MGASSHCGQAFATRQTRAAAGATVLPRYDRMQVTSKPRKSSRFVTNTALKRRHNARFNTLYCDVPIDSLKREEFFNTRDNALLSQWNNDAKPHRELIHPGEVGLNPPNP